MSCTCRKVCIWQDIPIFEGAHIPSVFCIAGIDNVDSLFGGLQGTFFLTGTYVNIRMFYDHVTASFPPPSPSHTHTHTHTHTHCLCFRWGGPSCEVVVL